MAFGVASGSNFKLFWKNLSLQLGSPREAPGGLLSHLWGSSLALGGEMAPRPPKKNCRTDFEPKMEPRSRKGFILDAMKALAQKAAKTSDNPGSRPAREPGLGAPNKEKTQASILDKESQGS